jgi:hypothetical protein
MHFTLCDYIVDICENAIFSGAGTVRVTVSEIPDWFRFEVSDDGSGMSPEVLERARDPFYTDGKKHPGRHVGLGLPFLVQAAGAVGGESRIESAPGLGTTVAAAFPLSHLDTPPVGDIPSCCLHLLSFDGDYELEIDRRREFPSTKDTAGGDPVVWRIARSEIKDALGNLNDAECLGLLLEYLRSLEQN